MAKTCYVNIYIISLILFQWKIITGQLQQQLHIEERSERRPRDVHDAIISRQIHEATTTPNTAIIAEPTGSPKPAFPAVPVLPAVQVVQAQPLSNAPNVFSALANSSACGQPCSDTGNEVCDVIGNRYRNYCQYKVANCHVMLATGQGQSLPLIECRFLGLSKVGKLVVPDNQVQKNQLKPVLADNADNWMVPQNAMWQPGPFSGLRTSGGSSFVNPEQNQAPRSGSNGQQLAANQAAKSENLLIAPGQTGTGQWSVPQQGSGSNAPVHTGSLESSQITGQNYPPHLINPLTGMPVETGPQQSGSLTQWNQQMNLEFGPGGGQMSTVDGSQQGGVGTFTQKQQQQTQEIPQQQGFLWSQLPQTGFGPSWQGQQQPQFQPFQQQPLLTQNVPDNSNINPTLGQITTTNQSSQSCPETCPNVAQPVCNNLGIRFSNECFLSMAACSLFQRSIATYATPCNDSQSPPCFEKCAVNQFEPVCDSYGTQYTSDCNLKMAQCYAALVGVRIMPGFCKITQTIPVPVVQSPPVQAGIDESLSGKSGNLVVASCERNCPILLPAQQIVCDNVGRRYNNLCFFNVAQCYAKMQSGITLRITPCETFPAPFLGLTQDDLMGNRPNSSFVEDPCSRRCDEDEIPVCDNHGTTHVNECIFKLNQCHAQRRGEALSIASRGSCSGSSIEPISVNANNMDLITTAKPMVDIPSEELTTTSSASSKSKPIKTHEQQSIKNEEKQPITAEQKENTTEVNKTEARHETMTAENENMITKARDSDATEKQMATNIGKSRNCTTVPKQLGKCLEDTKTCLSSSVCASDGRTYCSQCDVDRARCLGHVISSVCIGECGNCDADAAMQNRNSTNADVIRS